MSAGTLAPAFAPDTLVYMVPTGFATGSTTVTPTTADSGASVLVDGTPVSSGLPSAPIPLPLGTTGVDVVVTAEDGVTTRTYLLTFQVAPGGIAGYVKASNTGFSDEFGFSVAMSGDTMVVGAPGEDSAATGVNGDPLNDDAPDSGAAYVFVRTGATWVQQAYLKASNAEENDNFGESVAISGDTIVVGSSGEDSASAGVNGNQADNSASGSGAAYVYVRVGGTWTQQAYLKSPDPEYDDQLGRHVAISGNTIVAGAFPEDGGSAGVNGDPTDNSVANSGAAFVFVRSGTTWTQQAYLKAANREAQDEFGWRVAISGDTVVVGTPSESSASTGVNGNPFDNSAQYSGAAYVFVRSGTTWTQQAYLKAANSEAWDAFGEDVAVSGDTVLVGARGEDGGAAGVNGDPTDNSAEASGAAYVFVRSGATWMQQAYLKAPDPEVGDFFGNWVALVGDTAVVGARWEDGSATGVGGDPTDNGAPDSGAAFLFTRVGTSWVPRAYVKASNAGSSDQFGSGVAISGDWIAVGARNEDSSATGWDGDPWNDAGYDSGAVFLYR